jgi:transposase-like protein
MDRQPYQRYEESYKLKVVNYYYEHNENRKATLEEFGIDHSCLRDWLLRYTNKEKVVYLLNKIENDMAKTYKQLPKDAAAAQAEYERVQQELELEKLRSAAYSKMIDVAEEEYKLPIRKKAGAKQ